MTVPTINVGGEHQHITHASHLLPLPTDTPYGNLALKWVKIIGRIIRLNRQIAKTCDLHQQAVSLKGPSAGAHIEELTHLLEEIAYWLRKTADELIGLSFLCEARLRGDSLPTSVDVDCIGRLLGPTHQGLQAHYSQHLPHLRYLNNISNAYKHSFVNSQLNIMGKDEPILYTLTWERNDLGSNPLFISIALRTLVREFDAFFQTAKHYLAAWPKNT